MTLALFLPLFVFCLTDSGTSHCVKKRNPFFVPHLSINSPVPKKIPKLLPDEPKSLAPKLLGIIFFNGRKSALIRVANEIKIVYSGDTSITGYTIITINTKDVIAQTSSGENKKWSLP